MSQWLPRILVLVTIAGLLAMHGVDAAATAAHDGGADDVTHGAHHAGTTDEDAGLHHAAAACMLALVTAVAIGARRRLVAIGRAIATATEGTVSAVGEAFRDTLHPPDPAWVRLCVIRR